MHRTGQPALGIDVARDGVHDLHVTLLRGPGVGAVRQVGDAVHVLYRRATKMS